MLICLSGRCASGNISTTFPAKTLCMIMNRLRSRGLAWRSFQYNLISWIQTVEKPASATFKALRLQASWSGFEDLRAESEPAGGGQGWWIWLTFYCSNASFFLFRVDLVDLHRFGHGLSRSFLLQPSRYDLFLGLLVKQNVVYLWPELAEFARSDATRNAQFNSL